MALMRRLLDYLLVLIALQHLSYGLKFDLYAHSSTVVQSNERCIRNFANKDTLVMITVKSDGSEGDGMAVNVQIKDAVGNELGRMKNIANGDPQKSVITTQADAAIDVCFQNTLLTRSSGARPSRHIELDVDIGADAKNWGTIQNDLGLKPIEAELRRIEEVTGEIVSELEYLRERELKLRDTNESTNERVKWFALATMGMLVALGAWQVLYLRAYFRSKHLI